MSQPKLVDQQVSIAYGDRAILTAELRKLFPSQKFSIEIKLGFFHLRVPRMITRAELERINEVIRSHYEGQDEQF